MGEIDLRIASVDEPPERDDDPADVVPEVSDGPAASKLGDLWGLGGHRVLCGNALDAAIFAAVPGEDRAAIGFTDPPYNVRIDGHASELGAIHRRLAESGGSRSRFRVDLARRSEMISLGVPR